MLRLLYYMLRKLKNGEIIFKHFIPDLSGIFFIIKNQHNVGFS